MGSQMTVPTERLWRDVRTLDHVKPARWYTLKPNLIRLKPGEVREELTARHSSALQ
jgi:hypothetical protein